MFSKILLLSALSFVLSFDDYYDFDYNSKERYGSHYPHGAAPYQIDRGLSYNVGHRAYRPNRYQAMNEPGFRRGYRRQNIRWADDNRDDLGEEPDRFGQNGRKPTNFKLAWTSKGKYKTSSTGDSTGDLFGNMYGYKGAHDNEGSIDAEGQLNKGIFNRVAATSKGQGRSAVIASTWVGGGMGDVGGSHDIGGEGNFALD